MFAVEIPICLGTCLLWLLAPAEYLGGFLGKRPHDIADYLLLQQSTAVVFSMFVTGPVTQRCQPPIAARKASVLGQPWACAAASAARVPPSWNTLPARGFIERTPAGRYGNVPTP